MNWDNVAIILTVLHLGMSFLVAPVLSIYAAYLWRSHLKKKYLQLRFPKLALTFFLMFIGYNVIYIPIHICGLLLKTCYYHPVRDLLVHAYFLMLSFGILMGRYWFTFIYIQKTQLSMQWRAILNPVHLTGTKYSNQCYRFVTNSKAIFIIGILQLIALSIAIFILSGHSDLSRIGIIAVVVVAVDLICIIRLMYTILNFVDFWYIHKEIKLHVIITLIFGLATAIVTLLFTLITGEKFGKTYNTTDTDAMIWQNYNITGLFFQIWFISIMCVSGILIVRWNENRSFLMQTARLIQPASQELSSKSPTGHELHHPIGINTAPLNQLLRYGKGYEAFMLHLTHEFSSENLLVLTELIQLQEILIEFEYLDKEETECYITQLSIPKDIDIPLPPELMSLRNKLAAQHPNSSEDKLVTPVYENIIPVWLYIYEKYVDPNNAPYMINIPYGLRMQLSESYHHMKAWSLKSPHRNAVIKNLTDIPNLELTPTQQIQQIQQIQQAQQIQPSSLLLLISTSDVSSPNRLVWNDDIGMTQEYFLQLIKDMSEIAREIFNLMKSSHVGFQFQRAIES